MKKLIEELLPCPFCGGKASIHLGKKTHCQLHGEPSQPIIIECRLCQQAKVSAGDVFTDGEFKARVIAVKLWNTRHNPEEALYKWSIELYEKELAETKEMGDLLAYLISQLLKCPCGIVDPKMQSLPEDQRIGFMSIAYSRIKELSKALKEWEDYHR